MHLRTSVYIPGTTVLPTCDARVKVILLFAYTAAVFLVDTWPGMGLMVALFVFSVFAGHLSLGRLLAWGAPVYAMAALTVVFGSINAQVGFALGCYYGLRMILLVLASFVVVLTTTSTQLTDALRSFIRPLGVFRFPVDDVAMVFSMAIRFIPLLAQELCLVHDAQQSRGAPFAEGSLMRRVSAWPPVFIPLLVGLFRRADKLSVAMDARCYGAPGNRRASLRENAFKPSDAITLLVFLALLGAISVFF